MRSLPFVLGLLLISAVQADFRPEVRWQDFPPSDFRVTPPPASGSSADMADMATVLQDQTTRTVAECGEAAEEDTASFSSTFGPNAGSGLLSEKQLMALTPLFSQVSAWTDSIVEHFKDEYRRVRPLFANRSIKSCPGVSVPAGSYSYPSYHATFGSLGACVLARGFPGLTQSLETQGKEVGQLRVIAGVHYPTDVAMGYDLGQQMCASLLADPGFVAQLDAAVTMAGQIRRESFALHSKPKPAPSPTGSAPAIPHCLADNGSVIPIDDSDAIAYKTSTPNGSTSRVHAQGPITALYPDKNGHNHFEINMGSGSADTLEVVYNYSFGALPKLQLGQTIEVCGDFINSYAPENGYPASPDGAIIHWIHKSTSSHLGGFIVVNGVLFGQGNGSGS